MQDSDILTDEKEQVISCPASHSQGHLVQYWGPAKINSDKRHGPKSSDSAQTK